MFWFVCLKDLYKLHGYFLVNKVKKKKKMYREN